MNVQYQHTQIGYFNIVALGSAFILIISLDTIAGDWISIAIALILLSCLFVFSTLTTIIESNQLMIRFGPVAAIKKTFDLNDAIDCRIVSNPWYYGWGVRLTSQGWLFNVSGLKAVEIDWKDGSKTRIGTDEPETLNDNIKKEMKFLTPFTNRDRLS